MVGGGATYLNFTGWKGDKKGFSLAGVNSVCSPQANKENASGVKRHKQNKTKNPKTISESCLSLESEGISHSHYPPSKVVPKLICYRLGINECQSHTYITFYEYNKVVNCLPCHFVMIIFQPRHICLPYFAFNVIKGLFSSISLLLL